MSDEYQLRKDIDNLKIQLNNLDLSEYSTSSETEELKNKLNDDLSTLDTDLTTFSNTLTTLKQNIIEFNGKLIDFDEDNTNLDEDLDKLKDNLGIFTSAVKTLSSDLTSLDTTLGSLSQTVGDNTGGLVHDLNSLTTSLNGLSGDLTGLVSDLNILSDYMVNFEGSLADFQQELIDDGVQFDTLTLQSDIINLFGSISSVKEDVTTVNEDVYGDGQAKQGVLADVSDVQDTIGDTSTSGTILGDIHTAQGQIEQVQTDIGDMSQITGDLATNIDSAKSDITQVQTDIGDMTQITGDLVTNIDNSLGQIDTIQNTDIPAVRSDIKLLDVGVNQLLNPEISFDYIYVANNTSIAEVITNLDDLEENYDLTIDYIFNYDNTQYYHRSGNTWSTSSSPSGNFIGILDSGAILGNITTTEVWDYIYDIRSKFYYEIWEDPSKSGRLGYYGEWKQCETAPDFFDQTELYRAIDGDFSQKGHTHSTSDISGFSSHTHTQNQITDFSHTHQKTDITDFSHTHTVSDITDLGSLEWQPVTSVTNGSLKVNDTLKLASYTYRLTGTPFSSDTTKTLNNGSQIIPSTYCPSLTLYCLIRGDFTIAYLESNGNITMAAQSTSSTSRTYNIHFLWKYGEPSATPTSISISSDKSAISHMDSESCTFTADAKDTDNNPCMNIPIVFKKGSTVLDTVLTDGNGLATYTYNSDGVGNVTITAEYGNLSDTETIEDCFYYSSYEYGITRASSSYYALDNNLLFADYPTNYSLSVDIKTTGAASGNEHRLYLTTPSAYSTSMSQGTQPNPSVFVGYTVDKVEGGVRTSSTNSATSQVSSLNNTYHNFRIDKNGSSYSFYCDNTLITTKSFSNLNNEPELKFLVVLWASGTLNVKNIKLKSL